VFADQGTLDAPAVHLHLEHRFVQRLLGRFRSQGFVHNDLARACVGVTDDPVPRVILLGRLSLYGAHAARLHDEILAVAARWSDASARSESLKPYADATLEKAGNYTIRESEISFTVAGKELVLKQRPWKLGKLTGAELLASNPGYQRGAKSYTPDAAILKRLKGHKEAVRVLTFFGTWCPHCKQRLPLLLKVEQGLAGSKFQFEYYGLPSPFDSEPEAKSHKIDGVPTAILYVGDKEIGRIPHSQWSNPEVALDLQLNGPGRSKAR
jgi:thiol-disulfide isomerase/thioredoxin